MHRLFPIFLLLIVGGLCFFGSPYTNAQQQENLINNGGFENGVNGWQWEKWNNKPQPGYLNRQEAYEGLASYTYTLPDSKNEERLLMTSIRPIDPDQDYELSLALSCKDMPERGLVVNLLQWGTEKNGENGKVSPQSWIFIPKGSGVKELIRTGGTHDWQVFTIRIPAETIKPTTKHLTLMLRNSGIRDGVVGVDAVSFKPVEKVSATEDKSSPAPAATTVQTSNKKKVDAGWSYQVNDPAVLRHEKSPRLMVRATPEKSLYTVGQPPTITVDVQPIENAKVSWQVLDGFGNQAAASKSMSCDQPRTLDVTLPKGLGYYEVVAQVERDGQVLKEARRSIGLLSPIPQATANTPAEPFGLWVQGRDHYAQLGVRWTRMAFYPDAYARNPKGYVEKIKQRLDDLRAEGIHVLMYPKGFPKEIEKTQKVIKQSPENWEVVKQFWSEMVQALAGHVDVWGVINEPYEGMWTGDNELIIKYWSLMSQVIDQYDPDTPLIGPSLNTNKPHMMQQYQQLVEMGLLQWLDGIELHTYTADVMPANAQFADKIAQTRAVTQEGGRELPLYSSEMGYAADYDHELDQARYTTRSMLWIKRLDLKMVIWHMFSWPQGPNLLQRNFATFRNGKDKGAVPQPRPAGVAYGVVTRQLSGAAFRRELDYLGPGVEAFVFEREGQPLLAVWALSPAAREISLAVDRPQVEVTDIFGRSRKLSTQNGVLTLPVDGSPQFVSMLPQHMLNAQSFAAVDEQILLLPGNVGETAVVISNPTSRSIEVTSQPISKTGWEIAMASGPWSLEPGQSVRVPVRIKSAKQAAVGDETMFVKLFMDGRYASPVALPIRVQPQVDFVKVTPGLDASGRPVLRGQVVRHDTQLDEATLQLKGQTRSEKVTFDERDTAEFVLPVGSVASDQLQAMELTLAGDDGRMTTHQGRYSFVSSQNVEGLAIDGQLDEWSVSKTDAPFAVQWTYTPEALVLGVAVQDQRHLQDRPVDSMWMQDSLQIAVAPMDESQFVREPVSEMSESRHVEFALALNQGQVRMHRSMTPNMSLAPIGEVADDRFDAAIQHAKDQTIYEVALPWSELGLHPLKSGDLLKVSVLLNQDDGDGRKTVEWFGGIVKRKSPAMFGHLILQQPAEQ